MTTSFIPVIEEDIPTLASLAEKIWTEHYPSLISEAQVSYMVEKYQSISAITRQIKSEGYNYYFITRNQTIAGYFGIVPKPDHLFLSKLYIEKQFRGKGLAHDTLIFIRELAEELNLPSIRLTVNKGNIGSISAYEHLGFIKKEDIVTDIGEGFVMDDYVMEHRL